MGTTRSSTSWRPGSPGFPIAEVAADGSCVITKQPGTGGAVTIGTVTAQLLYEIDAPRYANPDVVARFDTIALDAIDRDRVQISGVRGEPPPSSLKVAINYPGGYRNTMTMVLTGLDMEAKAAHAETLLFDDPRWARAVRRRRRAAAGPRTTRPPSCA